MGKDSIQREEHVQRVEPGLSSGALGDRWRVRLEDEAVRQACSFRDFIIIQK